MKLVERLENRTGALRVAELFGVTPQHIYKMAASGSISSFRVLGSVRFDPDEVAACLEGKQNQFWKSCGLASFRLRPAFSRCSGVHRLRSATQGSISQIESSDVYSPPEQTAQQSRAERSRTKTPEQILEWAM